MNTSAGQHRLSPLPSASAANRCPRTGVPYGVIRGDAIDPDVWESLTTGGGRDIRYESALQAFLDSDRGSHETFDEDAATLRFTDRYCCDEPVYEGRRDGVAYRTGWSGGAPELWVFDSPVLTRCREGSICVPNAGDLCSVGEYLAYGVPTSWLTSEFMARQVLASGHVVYERDGRFVYQGPGTAGRSALSWTSEEQAIECCYQHCLQDYAIERDAGGVPTKKGSAAIKTLIKQFWDECGSLTHFPPNLARLAADNLVEGGEAMDEYHRGGRHTLLAYQDGSTIMHTGPRHLSLEEARRFYPHAGVTDVCAVQQLGMTVGEIKAAVDAGKKVYWSHTGYQVVAKGGHYLIVCQHNQDAIGLTHADGVTLNGKPEEFFVAA